MELVKKVNIKHPIDARSVVIQRDPIYPNAYIITLPLDPDPSYVWQTFFELESRTSLDFWERKVVIIGKELKLVTTPNNIEEKLNWLEGLVTATNRRVEEYNKSKKIEKEVEKTPYNDEEAIRAALSRWIRRRIPPY